MDSGVVVEVWRTMADCNVSGLDLLYNKMCGCGSVVVGLPRVIFFKCSLQWMLYVYNILIMNLNILL